MARTRNKLSARNRRRVLLHKRLVRTRDQQPDVCRILLPERPTVRGVHVPKCPVAAAAGTTASESCWCLLLLRTLLKWIRHDDMRLSFWNIPGRWKQLSRTVLYSVLQQHFTIYLFRGDYIINNRSGMRNEYMPSWDYRHVYHRRNMRRTELVSRLPGSAASASTSSTWSASSATAPDASASTANADSTHQWSMLSQRNVHKHLQQLVHWDRVHLLPGRNVRQQ